MELEELCQITRTAVCRIKDRKAREVIQAIYWDRVSLVDYARSEGISPHGAGERLQRGYAILRKDPRIIGLALAEGYDTGFFRYKGLGAYRVTGTSTVEDVVIRQEQMERQQSLLYQRLGDAAERAKHRQTALYQQLGELSGLSRSYRK